jgi:methylphosphotriester-DNA--protein-cysteine methyltransferase
LSKIAHRIEQIVLSAVSQHHFHRLFTSWAGVTPKDSAAITSATAAVPP